MDFTIIIASSRPDISECIKSLLAQKTSASFEIILVLDPGVQIELPIYNGRVRILNAHTTNPAAKRNIAAETARGKYLAFIDDDAYAPEDWLERAWGLFKSDEALAGCGGPNLPPENMPLAEKLTDILLSSELGSGGSAYKTQDQMEPRDARTGELHLVNMFVNRKFLLMLGGFNEALGYGSEDTEFIHAAKKTNHAKFIFDPKLTVIHRRRPFGMVLFAQRFKLRLNNGRLLMIKPSIYRNNRMLIGGLMGAWLILLMLVFAQSLLIIPAVLYVGLLAFFTVRSAPRAGVLLALSLPLALTMHHSVYLAGIICGFFKAAWDPKYTAIRNRWRGE